MARCQVCFNLEPYCTCDKERGPDFPCISVAACGALHCPPCSGQPGEQPHLTVVVTP